MPHQFQLNCQVFEVIERVLVIHFFIRFCLLHEVDRIYLIPCSILCTLSCHIAQFRASSALEPVFFVSSTCFTQIFFGRLRYLLSLTSRSKATLNTLPSFLLNTCPCHHIPFAIANPSAVSFCSSISIYSSVVFLYIAFLLHMALALASSILHKIAFIFSFKHHVSLPCGITDLVLQR